MLVLLFPLPGNWKLDTPMSQVPWYELRPGMMKKKVKGDRPSSREQQLTPPRMLHVRKTKVFAPSSHIWECNSLAFDLKQGTFPYPSTFFLVRMWTCNVGAWAMDNVVKKNDIGAQSTLNLETHKIPELHIPRLYVNKWKKVALFYPLLGFLELILITINKPCCTFLLTE